jgi:uracil-DNA glycosylase
VGRLAIARFIPVAKLDDVIGKSFSMHRNRHRYDLIALPHPSGVSPWHKIPPGKALLGKAMRLIAHHEAIKN